MGLVRSDNVAHTLQDTNNMKEYVTKEYTYIRQDDLLGMVDEEVDEFHGKRHELTEEEFKTKFDDKIQELQSLLDNLEISDEEIDAFVREEKLDEMAANVSIENRVGNPFAIRQDISSIVKSASSFEEFKNEMEIKGHSIEVFGNCLIVDGIKGENLGVIRNRDGSETSLYDISELERRFTSNREGYEKYPLGSVRVNPEEYFARCDREWQRQVRNAHRKTNIVSYRDINGLFYGSPSERLIKLSILIIKMMYEIMAKIVTDIHLGFEQDKFYAKKKSMYEKWNEVPSKRVDDAINVVEKYKIGTVSKAELVSESLSYEISHINEKLSVYQRELYKLKKKGVLENKEIDNLKANIVSLKADLNDLTRDKKMIDHSIMPFLKDFTNHKTHLTKELENLVEIYRNTCGDTENIDKKLLEEIRSRENSYNMNNKTSLSNDVRKDASTIKQGIENLKNAKSVYVKVKKASGLARCYGDCNVSSFTKDIENRMVEFGKIDYTDRKVVKTTHSYDKDTGEIFTKQKELNPKRRYCHQFELTTSPRDPFVSEEQMMEMADYFVKNCEKTLSKCQVLVEIHSDHCFNENENKEAFDIAGKSNGRHAHLLIGGCQSDGFMFSTNEAAARRGDLTFDDYTRQAYMVDLEFGRHSSAQHTPDFVKDYKILQNEQKFSNLVGKNPEEAKRIVVETGIATGKITFTKPNSNTYEFNINGNILTCNGTKIEEAMVSLVKDNKDLTMKMVEDIVPSIKEEAKKEIAYSNANRTLVKDVDNEISKKSNMNYEKKLSVEVSKADLKTFWKDNNSNPDVLKDRIERDIAEIMAYKKPVSLDEFTRLMSEKGYAFRKRENTIEFAPVMPISKSKIEKYNETHKEPYFAYKTVSTAKLGEGFKLSDIKQALVSNYAEKTDINDQDLQGAIARLNNKKLGNSKEKVQTRSTSLENTNSVSVPENVVIKVYDINKDGVITEQELTLTKEQLSNLNKELKESMDRIENGMKDFKTQDLYFRRAGTKTKDFYNNYKKGIYTRDMLSATSVGKDLLKSIPKAITKEVTKNINADFDHS